MAKGKPKPQPHVRTHTVTLRLRVRDRKIGTCVRMARDVNTVWNFCNETSKKYAERNFGKQMSCFDMQKLLTGSSEYLCIGSAIFQEVAAVHAKSRLQEGKAKLRWRRSFGKRRSLGWIPFKARSVVVVSTKRGKGKSRRSNKGRRTVVRVNGVEMELFDSYDLSSMGELRAGNLSEDSRGNWFLNVTVQVPETEGPMPDRPAVGIDLGLDDLVVLSDGTKFPAPKFLKATMSKISEAQAKGDKRLAAKLHKKAANQRRDHAGKLALFLVENYSKVFIPDTSPGFMIEKQDGRQKSAYDAAWSSLRDRVLSRGHRARKTAMAVSERLSTMRCHSCGALSGPKGEGELKVREWACPRCGTAHDRDVNAAINVLMEGEAILASQASQPAPSAQAKPIKRGGRASPTAPKAQGIPVL